MGSLEGSSKGGFMKQVIDMIKGSKLVKVVFLILFSLSVSSYSFALQLTWSHVHNNPDGSQTLKGHVPLMVKNGEAKYQFHSNLFLSAQIIMPLSNQPQLDSLIQSLYNPTSPLYHQFLTPAKFAQSFGPSTVDLNTVKDFLNKENIQIINQSANGNVLNVAGSSQSFEHAFGIQINNYQDNEGNSLIAPNVEPTIPASLAGKIIAIGGLDNVPKY